MATTKAIRGDSGVDRGVDGSKRLAATTSPGYAALTKSSIARKCSDGAGNGIRRRVTSSMRGALLRTSAAQQRRRRQQHQTTCNDVATKTPQRIRPGKAMTRRKNRDDHCGSPLPAPSPLGAPIPGSPDGTMATADLSMGTAVSSMLGVEISIQGRGTRASASRQAARMGRAAAALDAAGHSLLEAGRVGDALESYRRALRLKRRLLAETGDDNAADAIGLGPAVHREEAMLDAGVANAGGEAGQSHEHDLQPRLEAILSSVATSVNNVTYAKQKLGLADPEDAMDAYRSSLALKRWARVDSGDSKDRGDEMDAQHQRDLSVAKTLNNIGTVHLSNGAYASALTSFREAYGMMAAILGPDHIDISTVRSNAGDALLGACRYGEAVEEYGEALRVRSSRCGLDHRKSKRLLRKIRIAAEAAAAKEAWTDRTSLPPAQIAFDDDDIRDFCLLTDDVESDEEEGPDGAPPWRRQITDLKSELDRDLDRMSDIGRELKLDVQREQTAMTQEFHKDDTDDQGQSKVEDPDEDELNDEKLIKSSGKKHQVTHQRGSARSNAPRIKTAEDAAAAVRDVKERLAKARERRKAREGGLEALRRVPASSVSLKHAPHCDNKIT